MDQRVPPRWFLVVIVVAVVAVGLPSAAQSFNYAEALQKSMLLLRGAALRPAARRATA